MRTGYPAAVRRLTIIAAVLTVAAAGCGRQSPEDAVRAKLDDFAQATAAKDYHRLCNDVLAKQLVQKAQAAGLSCEVALETGLKGVQSPKVQVQKVTVKGDSATAVVHTTAANQDASTDTLQLARQGSDWRVSSVTSPPSPAAGGGPPPVPTRPGTKAP
jgi:ketosteroid isomerase-like protein